MTFNNHNNSSGLDKKELSKPLGEHGEQVEFFKNAIGTLLILVKKFSLDLTEINAAVFNIRLYSHNGRNPVSIT